VIRHLQGLNSNEGLFPRPSYLERALRTEAFLFYQPVYDLHYKELKPFCPPNVMTISQPIVSPPPSPQTTLDRHPSPATPSVQTPHEASTPSSLIRHGQGISPENTGSDNYNASRFAPAPLILPTELRRVGNLDDLLPRRLRHPSPSTSSPPLVTVADICEGRVYRQDFSPIIPQLPWEEADVYSFSVEKYQGQSMNKSGKSGVWGTRMSLIRSSTQQARHQLPPPSSLSHQPEASSVSLIDNTSSDISLKRQAPPPSRTSPPRASPTSPKQFPLETTPPATLSQSHQSRLGNHERSSLWSGPREEGTTPTASAHDSWTSFDSPPPASSRVNQPECVSQEARRETPQLSHHHHSPPSSKDSTARYRVESGSSIHAHLSSSVSQAESQHHIDQRQPPSTGSPTDMKSGVDAFSPPGNSSNAALVDESIQWKLPPDSLISEVNFTSTSLIGEDPSQQRSGALGEWSDSKANSTLAPVSGVKRKQLDEHGDGKMSELEGEGERRKRLILTPQEKFESSLS
jgi:hypothetical protein